MGSETDKPAEPRWAPAPIAEIDPNLGAHWPEVVSASHAHGLFIRAIHAKRLDQAARALLALPPGAIDADGMAAAETAASACALIARYNGAERARLAGLLEAAGIDATPGEDLKDATQTHRFVLRINPAHLGRALGVANDDGFMRCEMWHRAALRSLLSTRSELTLIKTDDVTTRMTLRWRGTAPGRGWLQRLAPSEVDYQMVRWPAPLWPLYHLVKPLRMAMTRVSRWTPPGQMGPYLGTPTELIPALLDAASVTSDDVVMDLGCGDGRIIVDAARLRGCRAHGVEQDAGLVDRARARVSAASLDGLVRIEHGDMAGVDLARISVVFLFLPMDKVASLLPPLLARLAPGTRIIMHEQAPLDPALTPDRSMPLIAGSALSVGHLWGKA